MNMNEQYVGYEDDMTFGELISGKHKKRAHGQMTFTPDFVGKATSLEALSRKSYAPHSMANEHGEFLADMFGEYVARIYQDDARYKVPYAGRGEAIGFVEGNSIEEVKRKARELVRRPDFKAFILLPPYVRFQTYKSVEVYPFAGGLLSGRGSGLGARGDTA